MFIDGEMKIKDKLKKEWGSLHEWVKITLYILMIIFILTLILLLIYLIEKLFFGFGNWIGKSLGIPGY
jgi:hypothetical protein